uniref:Uncharacterized protein n=1 Tax=Ascaris lumbricoides TaxID=6252 RepID=A0A0M3HRN4_ASCLU
MEICYSGAGEDSECEGSVSWLGILDLNVSSFKKLSHERRQDAEMCCHKWEDDTGGARRELLQTRRQRSLLGAAKVSRPHSTLVNSTIP